MKTHIEYVQEWLPDLLQKKILDLGSGLGAVLIEIAKKGGNAVGIETSLEYVEITKARAKEAGVIVDVRQGKGEELPFDDNQFDFVNMTEVIEHVIDPEKVLRQAYRVLKHGGQLYVSVPNRFAFKDHHYDLIFVNWLPRSLSQTYIGIFGEHKNYSKTGQIGLERLDEMHYYTFGAIKRLCEKVGFKVTDIRIIKIKKRYPSKIVQTASIFIYKFASLFYFESFHLQLIKD